ncbi:MAG: hypothetical protein AB7I27_14155 [Bacteriovoracaceae bacterium]
MKILFILLLITFNVHAHEGEEEVTAKFAPRFGGRVSAVVGEEDHNQIGKDHHEKGEAKDHKDKHHDEAKYMAEIIVSDANVVRVYFYDLEMKLIDLAKFPQEIKGSIKSKQQTGRGEEIVFSKQAKNYVGKLPPIKKKPYDMTLEFRSTNEPLHISFKAMD